MDHFEADCEGCIPGLDDDEMSKLLDDLSGDCDEEEQDEQQSDCENEEENPMMVEVVAAGSGVAGSTNFESFNRSLSTSNQSSSQQSIGFHSVSTLSQSTFGGDTPPDDDAHDDSADDDEEPPHLSRKIKTSSACWPHFTKLVAESYSFS